MKKTVFLFLILFVSTATAFGQQPFDGFYKIMFFDVFGTSPVVEGFFKVENGAAISGSIKYENQNLSFTGTVKKNGKFTARTAEVEGFSFIVEGKIPKNAAQNEEIEFTSRREIKTGGGKQISKNTKTGTISRAEQPKPEPVYTDAGIADDGKTFLKIEHANPLFGKEWTSENAKVRVSRRGALGTFYEMNMKDSTSDGERNFIASFQIPADANFTTADRANVMYSEYVRNPAKRESFIGMRKKESSGKIEVIGETDEKIVFKLVNVKFYSYSGDLVQIDGFIHAVKEK